MRVLVACEFSGRVRDAFISMGHNAISCDLERTEIPGPHYRGDVREILDQQWDMLIAFPPCTYLCNSGARWKTEPGRAEKAEQALEFVTLLLSSKISKICLENPIGMISTRIRKPDQIVEPYQFGDPERKSTCLWLKGLPKLRPTKLVEPRMISAIHYRTGGARQRSKTFPGIALAMAQQWG